jgi:HAD superfamily hydrolase (TIGR01490 family)
MKKIIIFDFDNVIIRGQSQFYLVNYLIKNRKIQFSVALQVYFWFFLKKIGFSVPPSRIRNIAYKTFKGWTVEFFEDFFRKFHHEIIQSLYIPGACKLLKSHLENNDEVIVVSATLKKIVENCLSSLNVDCCIATELEIVDNRYTGLVKGVVPFAEEKFLVIKEFLEKRRYESKSCIAYTDDFSDLELLNFVTFPIAVNPDSKLRRMAVQKGWRVYDF